MTTKQNPIQPLDEAELTQVNGGFISSSAGSMSYNEGTCTIKGPDLYMNQPLQGGSNRNHLQEQGQNEEAAMLGLGPTNGFDCGKTYHIVH